MLIVVANVTILTDFVILDIPEDYMLGNVVISKKFLPTRKIMVMHSNERGECSPCTLVDQKRKH